MLINSNPATIMTDPELADRTYVEPLTVDAVRAVTERERPDALLPTVGGQTALNLAVALAEDGTLERFGVELIGAKLDAIKVAEDRMLFKHAMEEIGLAMPRSGFAKSIDQARELIAMVVYTIIAVFAGGTGGGIAYTGEYEEIIARARAFSDSREHGRHRSSGGRNTNRGDARLDDNVHHLLDREL